MIVCTRQNYSWKWANSTIIKIELYTCCLDPEATIQLTTHHCKLHIAIIPKDVNEPTLEHFWLLETTGTLDEDTQKKDGTFVPVYQPTCINRNSDGAYIVSFPWKPNHPYLPANFAITLQMNQEPRLMAYTDC